MVTRRSVLKNTAAASIAAIAAAHGAAPAEAASSLDLGYGQLTGGAIGAFQKQPDAFQIAAKFDKATVDVVLKEELTGGVAVFFKYFQKVWSDVSSELLDSKVFPDLKTSDLYFSKLYPGGAELFVKNELGYIFAKIQSSPEGVFFKYDVIAAESD
jgi:hypothetical protein